MFGTVTGGRPTSVGIPEGQRSVADAQPGTVVNFVEAKTYAVRYADSDGRVRTTLMHRIGGVWHIAPNGENYAATLRPLATDSKLAKTLEDRFLGETTTATLPKEDAVDVLGGEE
jgi:hypothetical protein